MRALNVIQQQDLNNLMPGRVAFDETERRLYGHDLATIPALVRPLLGNCLPDGVVQPASEAELCELVQWAHQQRVPLTPRGKATAGYGGAVPLKHGLVVDFYHLRDVLDIDEEAMTVTVQAGAVWETVDEALADRGLTLRLYPSSYPSSTVGGWLAQGGAGIGSFEMGWFRDSVVSARIVLPSGEIRSVDDGALDLVSDAEGITGFILDVTLKVQDKEPLAVRGFAVEDPRGLRLLAEGLVAKGLPVWSALFFNPTMACLKNEAPDKVLFGERERHVELPEKYLVLITFREKDAAVIDAATEDISIWAEASCLLSETADYMWQQRFNLLRIKRLGPSVVPTEVVVPLDGFERTMIDLEEQIDLPLCLEGTLIKKGRDGKAEAVILGFIPCDERKLTFSLAFGQALTAVNIAKQHGGRPYSTGLFFKGDKDMVLGAERAKKMAAEKQAIDPHKVLNPGKVLGRGGVDTFLDVASHFGPVVRFLGNRVSHKPRLPTAEAKDGIPGDLLALAYSCTQCGYCVDTCDQFYGRGWESQSPRGKWFFLRELAEGRMDMNQKMVDSFIQCTTCGICDQRCCAALPVEHSWMKMRGVLIHEQDRLTAPPFEMMGAALSAEGDIWAGYRKDRDAWFPDDLREKHGPGQTGKVVYFAGCTASYVEKDIGIGAVRLLDEAGIDFTVLGQEENCCGTPMLVAGKWTIFEETMRKNLDAVKAAGADTIVTSCPACDMMWRQTYKEWAEKLGIEYNITTRHYSEMLGDALKDGTLTFPEDPAGGCQKVTWHDSCHIGRVSGVYEPPRDLIKAVPGVELVEMKHNRKDALCCGSVLTLITDPPVAADVGAHRLQEAVDVGADKVLALCPCCEFQLRVSAEKKQTPVEVVDLARFCAERLGYELPDPHPEVRAQWAVFEKMIELMTPAGFAALMSTMWSELVDATPWGMGKMMRWMGRAPFLLKMMKPLFPVLFPLLLPKMMPKVMDTMLARVADVVPMPAYMAEQMPDMMPQVMDNLMPHMIDDVVPLVTDPLIAYLSGAEAERPAA